MPSCARVVNPRSLRRLAIGAQVTNLPHNPGRSGLRAYQKNLVFDIPSLDDVQFLNSVVNVNFGERDIMRKLLVSLLAVFCLSVSALAQSSASGTVSGQVTDQQGAIIPGVQIKLTDPSTNITLTATTNEAGRFNHHERDPDDLQHHVHQDRVSAPTG